MGQPLILRHTYTRSRDTARAGLRYYHMRPRGEDEPPRSIFGADGTMTRDEAYRLLDAHQVGGAGGARRGHLAHRLMLSPPADRRPDDLRALTRHVMAELARDKRQALHWVAVEHRNTGHPHVHIVLCGGGERDGMVREVRLDRGDHARIKEDGLDYCRLVARVRDDWDRALAAATRGVDVGRETIAPPTRGRDDGWERG